MATTIEILLRTSFEGQGVAEARQAIKKVADQVGGEGFGQILDIEATGLENLPLNNLKQLIAFLQEAADAGREFAKVAAEMGDKEEAKKLDDQARAAQNLANQFKRLGTLTRSEVIKNFTKAGQTLREQEKSLIAAAQRQKELAVASRQAGAAQRTQAEVHEQNAKVINQEIQAIRALNTQLQQLGRFGDVGQMFAGTEGLDQVQAQLRATKAEAEALLEAPTTTLSEAMGARQTINDVSAMQTAIFGVSDASEEARKHMTKWGGDSDKWNKIMESGFNKLGFALFVTTSTLRNIIGIMRQLRDAAVAIEQATVLWQRFSQATEDAAINAADLQRSLDEASGGLLDFRQQQQEVITLINAGLPEIAAQADELVRLSRMIELFTAGTSKAVDVYPQLVQAIIDGDAAALESIPGLEGIADKLKLAQINAGEFDLSKLERQNIIIDGLAESFDRLENETKDLETAAGDLINLGDELKEFGLGLSTVFKISFADAAENLGLIRDSGEFLLDGQRAALRFAQGLRAIGAFAVLAFSAVVITVQQAVKTLKEEGQTLGDIWESALDLDVEGVKKGLGELGDSAEDTGTKIRTRLVDVAKILRDEYFAAIDDTSEKLGLLGDVAEDVGSQINQSLSLDDIELTGRDFTSPIEQMLATLQSPEFQLQEDLVEAWESHSENITEINQDLFDDLRDIREDAQKDLIKLQEDFNERSIELAEDLADTLSDIADDLALKEKRFQEDANDKVEKELRKSARKKEKIEEDHQKKIDAIMRRFELSRIKALIDRDARALFEAELKRNEDLANAKRAAEEKKREEERRLKEAQDEIERQLDKQLRRANEDAERRRQAAREQHDERMEDLREDLAEEREERIEALNEEIADRRAAAEKARKESLKQFKKQEEDLLKHFKRRQLISRLEFLAETGELLETWDGTTEEFNALSQEWGDEYRRVVDETVAKTEELIDAISRIPSSVNFPSIPGAGGPGGPPPFDPGGGGGGPPCQNIADIPQVSTGQPCSEAALRTFTAPDCTRWLCVDGFWKQQGSLNANAQGNMQGAPQAAGQFGGGQFAQGNGQGGPIPVTIKVVDDEKLDAVLKSVSYSAFVDIMGE